MECDAETLAELSKCFAGLNPRQQDASQIYLLCQISNNGGFPNPVPPLLEVVFLGPDAPDGTIVLEGTPIYDATTWNLGTSQYMELQGPIPPDGSVVLVGWEFAAAQTHYGSLVFACTGISTTPEVFWLADPAFGEFAATLIILPTGHLRLQDGAGGATLGTSATVNFTEAVATQIWWKYTPGGSIEIYASTTLGVRPETPVIATSTVNPFVPTAIWFISGDGININAVNSITIRSDEFP